MKLPWRVPLLGRRAPLSHLPPGTAPGTLVVPEEALPPRITVLAFGPDDFVETEVESPDALRPYLDRWPVTWVNVDGLGDASIIERVGAIFGVHPLALEDLFNVRHRPKLEEYDDHLFIITRMAVLHEQFDHEQLSLFLGRNYVLTFQERPGDPLHPVRQRLRNGRTLIRSGGADFLMYAIVDAVIDGYFPVLEVMSDRLEDLEEEVLAEPSTETIVRIQRVRHDLLSLRRSVAPKREFLSQLQRDEHELLTEKTKVYLRDAYDHTIRIVDLVESYREIATGLSDLYMSSVSNRMNDVMKVLTVVATIFIPLTFFAGLWGMNFDPASSPLNMPETRWYWGYPTALGLMVVAGLGMALYFRRKGWLGSA